MNAQERADLDALAELDSRPTAPQRVARTAGQGASAYVVLDLVEAFGWLGADDWSADQWKAVSIAAVAVVAALQNLGPRVWSAVGGWLSRRRPAA